MAHEFGHALQNHLEITDSFAPIKAHLVRMRAKGDIAIAREVSAYGVGCTAKGGADEELFAELFADYIMTTSPSPNAKIVGKMVDAAMNSQKFDEHFDNPLEKRDNYERTLNALDGN